MMLGPVRSTRKFAAAPPSSMPPKSTASKTTRLNGQPIGKRVLSEHVEESIHDYFQALNGHKPADLYRMVLEQVEAPLLRAVLAYCDQNQSRASEVLGLNRGTLRKKLKQYDITA